MNKPQFLELLDRYLNNKATNNEVKQLLNYYNSFQHSDEWNEEELGSSSEAGMRMFRMLQESLKEEQPLSIPFYQQRWMKIAAAAVVIFTAGSVAGWLLDKKEPALAKNEIKKINTPDHIAGNNNATLTLADGTTIILDSMPNGILSRSGNTSISKNGGILTLESSGKSNAPISYNTISISKGGQYQLVLPDQSKVWLNTASTLRFPSSFAKNERRVEVTGEAYFEVAKDKTKPFRVYIDSDKGNDHEGALVEVLGTHFNINAYNDESMMKTTLLEGSVKITPVENKSSAIRQSKILTPGEQAILPSNNSGKESIIVHNVNVEEVMAWTHSLFNFNTADIKTIMREIARWYDVEVIYDGDIPVRNFSGKIDRHTPLSNVLKILEQSNIHFRIENKKVIVTQ